MCEWTDRMKDVEAKKDAARQLLLPLWPRIANENCTIVVFNQSIIKIDLPEPSTVPHRHRSRENFEQSMVFHLVALAISENEDREIRFLRGRCRERKLFVPEVKKAAPPIDPRSIDPARFCGSLDLKTLIEGIRSEVLAELVEPSRIRPIRFKEFRKLMISDANITLANVGKHGVEARLGTYLKSILSINASGYTIHYIPKEDHPFKERGNLFNGICVTKLGESWETYIKTNPATEIT